MFLLPKGLMAAEKKFSFNLAKWVPNEKWGAGHPILWVRVRGSGSGKKPEPRTRT